MLGDEERDDEDGDSIMRSFHKLCNVSFLMLAAVGFSVCCIGVVPMNIRDLITKRLERDNMEIYGGRRRVL